MSKSLRQLKNKQQGLTLLETIIYFGLLALVMTTTLPVVFEIIKSFDQAEIKTQSQIEASFIVSKIDSVLIGATGFNIEDNGQSLLITNSNSNSTDYPVIIFLQDEKLKIKRGVDGLENSLTTNETIVSKAGYDIFERTGTHNDKLNINFNLARQNSFINLNLTRGF